MKWMEIDQDRLQTAATIDSRMSYEH